MPLYHMECVGLGSQETLPLPRNLPRLTEDPPRRGWPPLHGRMYLLMPDGSLQTMSQQPFVSEDRLQELVAEHPDLLTADNEPPDRWLLVARELGFPSEEGGGDRWAADHVFVDHHGIPTVVEVKRGTDSRLRREVVGQMLDYASHAAVYWTGDTLRRACEERCTSAGRNPEVELSEFLESDGDADAVWATLGTNLRAGRIRMVFVADYIPSELQRIVEFLNEQMNPAEVLALELRQFVGEEIRTIVPTLHGRTARGAPKARQAHQWDESSFMDEIRRLHGAEAQRIARQLLDWMEPQVGWIFWGKSAKVATFVPIIRRGETKLFHCIADRPHVEIYF